MKRTKIEKEKKKPEKTIKKKAAVKKTKAGQTGKSKPEKKLRVLILEDNPADAELMERQLRKAGIGIVSRRADTRSGFLNDLKAFKPDLILADYKLPKFDALQALALRNKTAIFTPFIIVTGAVSEEIAVECMKQGADDYLLKDRLTRLGEAVKHALETRRLREEKTRMEATLQNNEQLYRSLIDSTTDLAFLKDDKFRHLLANQALCRFYKKAEKEIVGKTDAELMDKSAAVRCRRTDRQALTGNRVHVSEETVGNLTFETRKFPVKLSDNRIGVGSYIRDISEGKRIKEALQAAAARWRTTFDSMNDTVCLLDEKGAVRQCNRAMNRLLGLPYEKIIGRDCLKLVCGARKRASCAFTLALRDGRRHEEEMFWRDRWYQVAVDPILDGERVVRGAVHVMSDITDAKNAKVALRESEERFRGLYENANIGMYRTTLDGRILMANPALIRMLGYGSFAELAERNLDKEGFEPDYPRREFRRQIERVGYISGLEAKWHKKDGTSIFVRESARVVKDAEGTIVFYDGTVEDISERKRAEESLREMNEMFRLFLKHSPIYVFIKDENIRPIYLSDNYEKMLGRPVADLLGKSMDELFPSELSRSMVENDKAILSGGAAREFEEIMDGRVYSTIKFPILIAGKPKYLAGYTMDITERQQIEAELKESENRYRNHFENSSEFYFTLDLKGNFVDVNKAAVSLTGYAKSELLKMNFVDYTPKRDHRKLFLALAKIYKTGEPIQNFLVEAIVKDKSIKFFETNFSLLKDGERIIGVHGSSKDITERRCAEELLHERDQLLQNLSAQIPGMIYTFLRRPDGRYSIPYSSSIIKDNFGVAPQDVCQDAAPLFAAILAEDRPQVTAAIEESARTLSTWQQEFRVQLPGQPLRWVWGKSEPFRLADGSILWYGFNTEITERKQVEEKLRASLQEKEVLLKEIHHRVKNNLQVISGLLTLQAQQIDDERLRNILQDSQSRVWTMATIHQTLYQSGTLADIEIADHIRGLTGNLLSSHARLAMPPNVIFDLLPLRLAIDKAIPLALVLNELLTNAMKHAFPDGRPGEIRVSLRECRDRSRPVPVDDMDATPAQGTECAAANYELIVADNGVGLPPSFDPQSQKSLGLQLVAMLAKQMDGALAIESAAGTVATITFHCHGKSQKKSLKPERCGC